MFQRTGAEPDDPHEQYNNDASPIYESGGRDLDITELSIRQLKKFHCHRTRDEQKELARKFRATGDLVYRDELLSSVVFYVIKLASKHARHFGFPHLFLDLIQEGMLGTFHAIDLYNPELGFAFSTYVTWWIRQAMVRFIANHADEVRVPVHLRELIWKLWRSERVLTMKLGRDVNDEDLLQHKLLTKNEFRQLKRWTTRRRLSLSDPVPGLKDNDDVTIGDSIADPSSDPKVFEELRESKEICQKITEFLRSKYNHRSAEAVIMRFGLDGGLPHKLEEIGRGLDGGRVTRERVRQIIEKVLGCPRFRWFLEVLRRGGTVLPFDKNRRVRPPVPTIYQPPPVAPPTLRTVPADVDDGHHPVDEQPNIHPVANLESKEIKVKKLSKMSVEELDKLRQEVDDVIKVRKLDESVIAACRRWYANAKKFGLTPQQVFSVTQGVLDLGKSWLAEAKSMGLTPQQILAREDAPSTTASEKGRGRGKNRGVLYCNPEDPSQRWAGWGPMPKWLKAKVAQGVSRESFRVS